MILWTHKRHPIVHTWGWALGCLFLSIIFFFVSIFDEMDGVARTMMTRFTYRLTQIAITTQTLCPHSCALNPLADQQELTHPAARFTKDLGIATQIPWFISLYFRFGGLVQGRRNSSALALELHLSCANQSIYGYAITAIFQYTAAV